MLKYPDDGGLKKPVRKLEDTLSIYTVIAKHYGLEVRKKISLDFRLEIWHNAYLRR